MKRYYRVILESLTMLGLFSLALWLRGSELDHFVTTDEHNWVYRSAIFCRALLVGDWPATSVWLTPGVTTTWLGTLALLPYYYNHQATINQPVADWLLSIHRSKIDLDLLLALRWAMALFTALMVGGLYQLGRRLWSWPVTVLGSVFVLSAPHLLATSRIIGHDAPVTFFMAGAFLAAVAGLQQSKGHKITYLLFILSGCLAGLSILSKAISLFLLPFIGLMIIYRAWQQKWPFKMWAQILLLWAGALWISFILAWPAAWVSPLGQTWAVIANAFLSAAGLEDPDIQPFWAVPDLGIWYYLVHGAFKLSPLVMIGLILALLGVGQHLRQNSLRVFGGTLGPLSWIALFALGFTIFMTFGVKKSPRYILPIFPTLAFMAAWGWLHYLKSSRYLVNIITLGGLSIALTLQYAPYYYTYFNPLLGGAYTAPHLLRLGWGEGLDQVARWLNNQIDAPLQQLGVRYTATLYPFYQGSLKSPISPEIDYVTFYIKQTQSGYPRPEILAYFEQEQALHRVRLNGIEYAQIYQGPAMQLVEAATTNLNLPLAYRSHSIYASPGETFVVDLIWPATSWTHTPEQTVTLSFNQVDGPMISTSAAATTLQQVDAYAIHRRSISYWQSRHQFHLPETLARDTYSLSMDDHSDRNSVIGQTKARPLKVPPDFTPVAHVFNNQLRLMGLNVVQKDERLRVDLAWQGWADVSNDYTVFLQLLNNQGERVTGVDVAPSLGFTNLDRREIMLTHDVLPLTNISRPGQYDLIAGLYYFAGDEIITLGTVTLRQKFELR